MIEPQTDKDFYQVDFTTASEWETFIAKIEEILCDWKLNQSSALNNAEKLNKDYDKWCSKKQELSFMDMQFVLSYYYLEPNHDGNFHTEKESEISILENLMATRTDFMRSNFLDSEKVLCLVHWYGLTDFLVLFPVKPKTISSESTVKLIVSSLSVAADNVQCELPVFAKVLEDWQNFFVGIALSKGTRADYQMVHLKKIPPQCKYLGGVLNVFKSQVTSSTISLDPIKICARFSYCISDWLEFSYFEETPYIKYNEGEIIDAKQFSQLPFGTSCEPVEEFVLHACWPEFQENVIVDSESYSDLEPMLAPFWSVRVTYTKQPNSLLLDYVTEYLEKCCNPYSAKELIGDLYQRHSNEPDLSQSLNLLTETKLPVISKLIHEVNVATNKGTNKGLIPDNVLMPVLYFLFPDADEENTNVYKIESEQKPIDRSETLKTCEVGSLVWRLAIVMSHIICSLGGIRSVAHLWYEFTQELRYRWENGILIPGIRSGNPDHKTCLLNQKLQLLNCCIKRKIARENPPTSEECEQRENESEEEVFYDCQAESTDFELEKSPVKHSPWNQPVGRLRKCDSLRLIKTGEPMYVPITQEMTPKTEDQLEEDAELLMKLGSDSYGSELRSRLMSASLYSDMESFKAANPGAELEDFIRWYSPRDWIEDEENDEYGTKIGHLSPRMKLPGNMWKEVWDSSKPVPAVRQKRLFNDTQEAEKVLHFLESVIPSGALRLLLPTFVHIVLFTVSKHANEHPFLNLETKISSIMKKAVAISRCVTFDLTRCQEFASDVGSLETVIFQYKSLKYKFFPEGQNQEQCTFISELMTGEEINVPSGPRSEVGNRIYIIFSEIQKHQRNEQAVSNGGGETNARSDSVFFQPLEKEFLLRVRASRPSSSSRKLPQKLVAKILPDQFLMAACFSQDIVFC